MVLVLGRKLLIDSLRGALALILLAAACGGSSTRDDEAPADAASPRSGAEPAASLTGSIENGEPMPIAERAGGVPPYPGAVVWMRVPRPPSEFRAFEAFTPDSFLQVVAYYDSTLAAWRRTVARDAVHYHRDPELVTLIVSPWEGEETPADAPAVLRQARTSIGVAWREDS